MHMKMFDEVVNHRSYSEFSVLRIRSYIPEPCKKNAICAVIAGRSTKPRGFDNENENTEIRTIY